MAMNVFGNPITNTTLQGMPDYENKVITAVDRAAVALNMKNARGNDSNVLEFVIKVGTNSGFDITTLCVMYNATGGTLTFVDSRDWYGHIAESPYPVTIANGQWAGFVHVKSGGTSSGSHAGVVYRGKDKNGLERDWMFCWRNAFDRNNVAYTEIREKDHFQGSIWDIVYKLKENSGRLVKMDNWIGCKSSVSTGRGYRPVVEAIFTLEDA